MNKLTITLGMLIVIFIAAFLYYREGNLPVNRTDTSTKVFIIKPGETVPDIAKNLESEKLIRNKIIFYWTVKRLGIDNKIQAGDFRLSPSLNTVQIAQNLTKGTLDVWVTVIEGLRKEQTAQIFSQELGIPEIEFAKNAKEGYLFPDTYLIPKSASSSTVINIMSANFAKKFSPVLQEQSKKTGLTPDQVVTLASIVEKEAATFADKKQVANILLRRIKEGKPLQVDTSIAYALGYQEDTKKWWKEFITFDDLKIDSPYNLYTHEGLPPTPICSPGLDALTAAAEADANTPYLFFISDKQGAMHYSKTDEEHQATVDKYLDSY
jgi:UPF0755 protein